MTDEQMANLRKELDGEVDLAPTCKACGGALEYVGIILTGQDVWVCAQCGHQYFSA
jgi:ribosomal protein L37AE/L43A